jgi:copper chaperone CopZ
MMAMSAEPRIFSVPGVTCGHCKQAIETELAGAAGVTSAVVDVDTKTVTVSGDANDEAIVAAIDEAGYDAVRT